jgi:arsenate reductase
MSTTTIWHNQNCSTSRHAVETAGSIGADVTLRKYLTDHPSRQELLDVMAILEDPPADLVRKDSHFESLGLDPADYTTPEKVADILVEHPRLIQRPVLIRAGKAIIGRPKDRVAAFLA